MFCQFGRMSEMGSKAPLLAPRLGLAIYEHRLTAGPGLRSFQQYIAIELAPLGERSEGLQASGTPLQDVKSSG